jgi:hypothetical protein
VHAVIKRTEVAELLPLAANHASGTASVAEQLASLVEAEVSLPPHIAGALVNCTIRSDRIRSRLKVADAARCGLRQLDEALSRAFGKRPKIWVTWRFVVRTLRAYDLAYRGVRANEVVARELDTTTKALCRGYERIAGVRSFEQLSTMIRRDVLTCALIALGLRTSSSSETLHSVPRVWIGGVTKGAEGLIAEVASPPGLVELTD